jgi:hypothetical protein
MNFFRIFLLLLLIIALCNLLIKFNIQNAVPKETKMVNMEIVKYEWRDVMEDELEYVVKKKVSDHTVCGSHKCPDHVAIQTIKNAVIASHEGLIYDDKKRIYALGYWFWKNKKIPEYGLRKTNKHFKRAYSFSRIWEWTFQHASMGTFPKARYFCKELTDDKDAKIIIANDVQHRVLNFACPGIEEHRYHYFKEAEIKVDQLLVIRWITSETIEQGKVLSLAASPKNIITLPKSDVVDTLFYMKRERKLGKRYVINDDQVIATLKEYCKLSGLKFEIFDGDVSKLIRAAFIIGPHGGAIANLIYTNRKTKVVEFITQKGLVARPCYDLLSQTLSLDYYYIEPTTFNFDNGGMKIDIKKLDNTLINI